MHYYQFNIGDYRRDTQHLTPLEHGVYRLLLDQYYLTEIPLDANALRLLCIRSADDVRIAENILKEFFIEQQPGQFVHKRAMAEIEKYRDKSVKATESAKKRWGNANALRTQYEGNANHKPLTKEPINHKPSKTPSALNAIAFDGTTWLNTDKHFPLWQKAYPALDLKTELSKAAAWMVANPKNTKSNYARFLTNWFARAQDRAPATNSPPAKMNNADKYLNSWGVEQKELTNERDITGIAERLD